MVITALLVVAAGTIAGVVGLAVSSAYDYHLQSIHMEAMNAMRDEACDAACAAAQQRTDLALQVRAVAVGGGLMLVTNLVLVGWAVALRGGRLVLGTRREVRSAPNSRIHDLRLLLVAGLVGSAVIHAAVIPEHLEEWPAAGSFFVVLAIAELALGLVVLVRLDRLVLGAVVAVSVVPLGLWLVSRTVGLPLGPETWTPEAVGLADVGVLPARAGDTGCGRCPVAPPEPAGADTRRFRLCPGDRGAVPGGDHDHRTRRHRDLLAARVRSRGGVDEPRWVSPGRVRSGTRGPPSQVRGLKRWWTCVTSGILGAGSGPRQRGVRSVGDVMSNPVHVGASTLRAAPALLVLVAALLPAAAMADEPQPVVISGFAANPSALPPAGGMVILSAVISSPAGISHAAISVYQADGGITGTDLALTDPATDTWSGQVTIPGNASNEPVSHTLEIFAQANDGGSAQEIVGSIDVAGQPVFDQAPDVFDAALDPVSLPASGGPVTIRASASDDRSVSEVNAVVSGAGGATWNVPMEPMSSSRFEGTWNAPPNPSPTLSATYSVEVTALDDIGQPGAVAGGDRHRQVGPGRTHRVAGPSRLRSR